MINPEIPYGTGIQIKCPSCGYEGFPNSKKKGMKSLEIVLYIFGIFPGIMYSIRRNSSRICCCPTCGSTKVNELYGNDEVVANLIALNRVQNYAFVAAALLFLSAILLLQKHPLTQNTQETNIVNTYYQQQTNYVPQNSHQTVTQTQITKSEPKVDTPKVEERVVPEIKEEPKPKDPNEEIREKMQNILKQIDYQYSEDVRHKVDSYIGASCSGDCIDGIINIKFAKNLGWESRVVESAAAIWSNNIIKSIPGYFDKLQINYICHDQTITSCTFTEYQTNTMVPKGCQSFGYKDTADEAREKMQNIIKETDKEYSSIDGYIGTTCLGDCTKGIINVNFSKDIGWRDFTVRSHIAMLNNKIMKTIPGFFNELWISFIYDGQTVCSCIFTEYQRNTMAPKGCTYFGYKK